MGTNYICGDCDEEFTSDEIIPIRRCPECLSDMITVDDGRGVNKCTTEKDYNLTLNRIEKLMDAETGTSELEELKLLSRLVEIYEDKHYPIPDVTNNG